MNNHKGFTLIELLAVIVILGLLLAIAIPGVSKYIEKSRKKTLVNTIEGYITSITNEVNNRDYKFSKPNTIFAVPIECIEIERGGENPFGEWMQANSKYWAYVLVEYDSEEYSYNYGFTFKDSAGYGLYPTTSKDLNKNGSQIDINLQLKKLVSGSYTNGADKENWNGFDVNESTRIKVLKSVDGMRGDGINTCTLRQKGSNYDVVKEEYKDMTLMKTNHSKGFWLYRQSIKTITFQNAINIPDDAFKSWDVSDKGNGMVMAYIKVNKDDSNYYDLYIQANGEIYANPDSSELFRGFSHLDSINNLDILNTSNVTDMSSMFDYTGSESSIFKLDLGDNFDTTNVTNMSSMFFNTGYNNVNFSLDLGNNFDTSNVVNMSNMFRGSGCNSKSFTLNLGNKFNTSNVTDMSNMFNSTGYYSTVFTLELGNKFNTSNVVDMAQMFYYIGWHNRDFKLDLGDSFDTKNVVNMDRMFHAVGNLSNTFTLDLGNKFDTSNVTNMDYMFSHCGIRSPLFKLDCSSWNVSNVTTHINFNGAVTSKVIPPVWVN